MPVSTRSARPSAAPGTPFLSGSHSYRGPVAALESDLPVPTLAPILDPKDARFREMATSLQNAQAGFAELLSRVSLVEERFGFVEMELAHSRESEREANDALIKFLALEARFALSAPPAHSPMGQKAPKLSVSAKEEPPLLLAEAEKPQARKGKRHRKSQGPRDPDHPSSDSDADSDCTFSPGGSFPFRGRASPGIQEIIPCRSGYRKLVSYRSHRMDNIPTVRRYNLKESECPYEGITPLSGG
jgi:hypothetical protein